MAITTELVGKLGGGLTWENVASFPSKTMEWNSPFANRVIYLAGFPTDTLYVYSVVLNVTQGGEVGTYVAADQTDPSSSVQSGIGRLGVNGVGTYKNIVTMPYLSPSDLRLTHIRFAYYPAYNSGTHTLSAKVYRAKFTDLLPS